MKKWLQKLGAGMLAAVMLSLAWVPTTLAWGPERPTYTMGEPADHATFNSITDNALIKDERQFVRIMEKDKDGAKFVSELTLEAGKQYLVYIYYHNDASETYNDLKYNQVGVAKDVRMMSNFPDKLAKDETGDIVGKITSSSTTPAAVWDEARVTAAEEMTLRYVTGSAKIYNHWHQDGTLIPAAELFSAEGTLLGTSVMNGLVFGCDRFSGSVRYTIETEGVSAPVEPDPEPEPPVEPVIPEELPNTGPLEIILAIVVVAAIIAGILYWNKSRKAVKRATKKAKSKKKR